MADSPCTCCGSRCNGKLWFAYLNYYDERDLVATRLRLCQACVFDHVAPLIETADRRSDRGNWIPAEGEKPWPRAAISDNTETAQSVADLLTPTNQDTSTNSTEKSHTKQPYAPSATDASSDQRASSSKRSKRQESDTPAPKNSSKSSTSA